MRTLCQRDVLPGSAKSGSAILARGNWLLGMGVLSLMLALYLRFLYTPTLPIPGDVNP
jgi:hypothetical protein